MKVLWVVVLLCSFLSPSVGAMCTNTTVIMRMNKEMMEEGISTLMFTSDISDKIMNLMNKPSDGINPLSFEQKSPSSPARNTVEIQKSPDVKATKNSDDKLQVHVRVLFRVKIRNAAIGAEAEVEIEKNFTVIMKVDSNGLTFESCSCPPGDGNITVISPKGLPEPMKNAIEKQVKEQICRIINQNFCDLVKNCFESPAGAMVSKVFVLPKGDKLHVESIEEDDKCFSVRIIISKEGEENPKEEQCTTDHTSFMKPDCPMKRNAAVDVSMKTTMIQEQIKSQLSEPFPMGQNPTTGETTTIKAEGVTMADDPKGQRMTYTPHFTTCKTGDSSDCEKSSPGTCSVLMELAIVDNRIQPSVASESCDKNTDSYQSSGDHKFTCHEASCKMSERMKPLEVPFPGNLGMIAELEMSTCKTLTVISACTDMFAKGE